MELWRGDFSTGDLSQWTGVETVDRATRLQVIDAPQRPGTKALRVLVKQSDLVQNTGNNPRNEVFADVPKLPQPEGSERVYRWSTLFPLDFPVVQPWQVFTQWHQSYRPDGKTIGSSPPVALAIRKDRLCLVIAAADGTDRELWNAPLPRGRWIDFELRVQWSPSGSVELRVDGAVAVARTPAATTFAGLNLPDRPVYLKQGLYRAREIVPDAVIFHQGLRVSDAAADLPVPAPSPAPAPPLAVSPSFRAVDGSIWTFKRES